MKLFRFKKNKKDDKQDEADIFLDEGLSQNEEKKQNSEVDKEEEDKEDWLAESTSKEQLGELAVDVYEKDDELIVKSTLAGVRPEDLEVAVEGSDLIIRGRRKKEEVIDKENYYYQECYWGGFERVLKLPIKIDQDNIQAKLKNGVLTVIIGKAREERKVAVRVEGD